MKQFLKEWMPLIIPVGITASLLVLFGLRWWWGPPIFFYPLPIPIPAA